MKTLKVLFTVVMFTLVFGYFGTGVSHAADVYTVQKGDSLWKIAVRYQIGLSEIIQANPQFKNPALIYPGDKVTVPNIDATKSIEEQVVSLTNQERAKYGLPALKSDWELSRVARYKSDDMKNKGYFSHTSPTYGSPFDMMKNFGISYRSAGENIAAGQTSASQVVKDWMNSEGHRANILSRDFTHIGVGYSKGGSYGTYWTQMFIKK
ncbi:hypothetical protein Q73_15360 [Bacillus coahuilensis m2-6]|uniref:LysM domain-containing protein n=1 Tax=Bacillus coahuilensis p1.1.43 TaxID=1150625 RepID=A0A147K5G5_9BACI|nr:SafA/ExsA family spore coat assembly protein [Bacillus coahuilensis]KUP04506.1 hypothetical protein Q73_15360 [Bacillus coahuilensis m2-6]KUP04906.1 hypothetical protein Q75_13815 [Bacillus coahuilensis p1.1.43]